MHSLCWSYWIRIRTIPTLFKVIFLMPSALGVTKSFSVTFFIFLSAKQTPVMYVCLYRNVPLFWICVSFFPCITVFCLSHPVSAGYEDPTRMSFSAKRTDICGSRAVVIVLGQQSINTGSLSHHVHNCPLYVYRKD